MKLDANKKILIVVTLVLYLLYKMIGVDNTFMSLSDLW